MGLGSSWLGFNPGQQLFNPTSLSHLKSGIRMPGDCQLPVKAFHAMSGFIKMPTTESFQDESNFIGQVFSTFIFCSNQNEDLVSRVEHSS